MRVLRLGLLGLAAFLIAVIVLFPAAPVIQRIEPQLGPVALDGVSGRLYKGAISRVVYDDGILPLEFSDVNWTLDPLALIRGTGADVRFDGYGGGGSGNVVRTWGGDLKVSDFAMNVDARRLEALLPLPIAQFSGALVADIRSLMVEGELLTEVDGTITWNDAVLEQPMSARLGDVTVQIAKDGPESHLVNVNAVGGELQIEGTINLAQDGDFSTNLLLTPSNEATIDVIDGLRRFARPEPDGRYRLQQQGNVNRLMG